MVKVVMVLMKRVWISILYKLSGNFESNACNSIVALEIDSIAS
jgi:hypothetical protein